MSDKRVCDICRGMEGLDRPWGTWGLVRYKREEAHDQHNVTCQVDLCRDCRSAIEKQVTAARQP